MRKVSEARRRANVKQMLILIDLVALILFALEGSKNTKVSISPIVETASKTLVNID